MKQLLIFFFVMRFAQCDLAGGIEVMNPCTDEYIAFINSNQDSWTAGRNFPTNENYKLFKQRLGLLPYALTERLQERKPVNYNIPLPKHFDARLQWSECETISDIRDQSTCEACWAFAPVEVIADRICIHSENQEVVRISSQELVECCYDCAPMGGCKPGSPVKAWKYWYKYGLVTGGDYNDNNTCLPFTCPPCEWSSGTCKPYHPPNCVMECQKSYGKHFDDDKYYGEKPYSVPRSEQDIMAEILLHGPVQAVFKVYYDFICYKHGVYRHNSTDKRIFGGHAVKILGWGEERGIPFWLVANSEGRNFGDLGGFFKILRGSNECGIEAAVHAGIPQQKNKKHKLFLS